jgi:hypothetical protein
MAQRFRQKSAARSVDSQAEVTQVKSRPTMEGCWIVKLKVRQSRGGDLRLGGVGLVGRVVEGAHRAEEDRLEALAIELERHVEIAGRGPGARSGRVDARAHLEVQ